MKTVLLLLALITLAYAANVEIGTCYLRGTIEDGDIVGVITFTAVNATHVTVTANVTGIDVDGEHGMHVHTFGDISNIAGNATAGHWNPAGSNHSCPENPARHYGDMGNWTVDGNAIDMSKTLDLLSLTGGDSILGRAVILHDVPDDCVTPPAGGPNKRIAQCVIGKANPGTGNVNVAMPSPALTQAICVLTPASGSNVTGTIYFDQAAGTGPTRVYGVINGLDGMPHGFHIHQFGDVSNSTGGNAGGHFNPLNVLHGIPPFPTRHIGDMGNIYHYDINDVAYYDYSNNMISLNGEYPVVGLTVIVHNNTDNCVNPIGEAGGRLAQCVIGIRNPITTYTLPTGVPSAQNDTLCQELYPTTAMPPPETTDDPNMAASTSVAFVLAMISAVFALLF